MVDGDHPEEDELETFDNKIHKKCYILIGMLNWIFCIGQMNAAFKNSSLSSFTACPRKEHMYRVLHIFGYSNKYNNQSIVNDSRYPIDKGVQENLIIIIIYSNIYILMLQMTVTRPIS